MVRFFFCRVYIKYLEKIKAVIDKSCLALAFITTLILTPGRRQSKTLLTIDERGSSIARNNVFDCHLSPVGRKMAIGNSVSNDFLSTFVDGINVFDCHFPGVFLRVASSGDFVETEWVCRLIFNIAF